MSKLGTSEDHCSEMSEGAGLRKVSDEDNVPRWVFIHSLNELHYSVPCVVMCYFLC